MGAAVPDVVSLLKQTDKSSGTGCAAIDLQDVIFPFQLEKGSKTICDLWLYLSYV